MRVICYSPPPKVNMQQQNHVEQNVAIKVGAKTTVMISMLGYLKRLKNKSAKIKSKMHLRQSFHHSYKFQN